MTGIIYVCGGARSGKTGYAQKMVEEIAATAGLAKIYIATAQAWDAEMADRIQRHQSERGPDWQTAEAPMDLPEKILELSNPETILLVDCLTLWLTNILLAERNIDAQRIALVAAIEGAKGPVVLVSNEVGMGIVPENALARRFRDEAGWVNQAVAKAADKAVLVASGLPVILKDNNVTE
ncbi:bifunctional adenosylcobinamide kinase/adenosylcobinamide-phosphate guanylyltransferase [Aestuariispira insulae]|uniref:Bifunctional adenosylcobalamin biosynthesis protein n=1 Tax=Aestuariispira insulae TaxID=1461337 RepID=A0A3D9HDX7_9PROT|nr:bifunctional adenosylcobinamide kinase/adenosylcobinamide-phosphate guanylyltransferase [Aestuariispira insulae]RED47668.1 adenosylcobinamide kinase /adenosylcobinamide-phosphate guanylyltransferase [Aestuariispira insulae]